MVSRQACELCTELCTDVSLISEASGDKIDIGSDRYDGGPLRTGGISWINLSFGAGSDVVRCSQCSFSKITSRMRDVVSMKETDGVVGSFFLFPKKVRALSISCSSSELSLRAKSWLKNDCFASKLASWTAFKNSYQYSRMKRVF